MSAVRPIPGLGFRSPDPNHILRAQPGNPTSLAKASTTIQTEAHTSMAGAQAANISSILFGGGDPGSTRHQMFQASAIIGQMWNLFSYAIQQQISNREMDKDTHKLALAAR